MNGEQPVSDELRLQLNIQLSTILDVILLETDLDEERPEAYKKIRDAIQKSFDMIHDT